MVLVSTGDGDLVPKNPEKNTTLGSVILDHEKRHYHPESIKPMDYKTSNHQFLEQTFKGILKDLKRTSRKAKKNKFTDTFTLQMLYLELE